MEADAPKNAATTSATRSVSLLVLGAWFRCGLGRSLAIGIGEIIQGDDLLKVEQGTLLRAEESFLRPLVFSQKIAEGRFQSVSEAVRAGLRRLEEDEAKLEALRAKLQAGKDSPLVEDFDPQQFLAEMREKSAR